MQLDLGKLSASELKDLDKAVKAERDRRGKKNPANHEAPLWTVPNKAVIRPQKIDAPNAA